LVLIELEEIVFALNSSLSELIITPFHAPESSHVGISFLSFCILAIVPPVYSPGYCACCCGGVILNPSEEIPSGS